MKLSSYLKQENLTQKDFLNVSKDFDGNFSQFALMKWCCGQRIPRADDMRVIYQATKGNVCPNDFYELN
jgi:hypothetical protein